MKARRAKRKRRRQRRRRRGENENIAASGGNRGENGVAKAASAQRHAVVPPAIS